MMGMMMEYGNKDDDCDDNDGATIIKVTECLLSFA